ncbi:IS3 family transposase [Chitinophaga silvatica]|uniref:IS3 family transposase n=1 Tax=Chitinophaga silvatica TaxID=2282649 RepID=UPI001F2538BF|nr:IS3 family transposase [Chitinophaga silvatica]
MTKAINELRPIYNLELLLQVAGLARSTFYYYLNKLNRAADNSCQKRISDIYHRHKGRYGYRRITTKLKQEGYVVNHKKVLRIMREAGLKSLVRPKKYRAYKGEQGHGAKNHLNRNFYAKNPHVKWVTDITEFNVGGKKLYFSPIMDLYNREIVSYTFARRPNHHQVINMLKKAINKLPKDASPILHSDQGWQYKMQQYQELLKQNDIIQSMSRKGNCLDNAVIENFFGILKSELFYLEKFDSIITLQKAIVKYVYYYNNHRIKLKLNGLSPVDYRTQAA